MYKIKWGYVLIFTTYALYFSFYRSERVGVSIPTCFYTLTLTPSIIPRIPSLVAHCLNPLSMVFGRAER